MNKRGKDKLREILKQHESEQVRLEQLLQQSELTMAKYREAQNKNDELAIFEIKTAVIDDFVGRLEKANELGNCVGNGDFTLWFSDVKRIAEEMKRGEG